jgi:uncharacterized protein
VIDSSDHGHAHLSWPQRLTRAVIAWLLISLGIALSIRARVGVAPADVLVTGISQVTHLSFGVSLIAMATVGYSIGWMLGAPPGPASVVGTFVIGPMVDVYLGRLPHLAFLPTRSAAFLLALLVIAAGICLAVSTNLGAGPGEMVMVGLTRKGLRVVYARWIVDGVPVVLGASIGGAVGVGTIVFALCMGALIKRGLRILRFGPR